MDRESVSWSSNNGRIVETIGWSLVAIGLVNYLTKVHIHLFEILVVFVALVVTAICWTVWRIIGNSGEKGQWLRYIFLGLFAVLGVSGRMLGSEPIFGLVTNLSSGLIFVGLGYLLNKPRISS